MFGTGGVGWRLRGERLIVDCAVFGWYRTAMQVIVDIPDEFVEALAPAGEDTARKILEDHTAQAYREGKLSSYQVQCILGLPTRMHVDPFLLKYEIYDYTVEDLEKDLAVLERLRP